MQTGVKPLAKPTHRPTNNQFAIAYGEYSELINDKLEPEARTIALIWKLYFELFGLFDSIAITHLRKVALITVEDYVELQEELWYNKSDEISIKIIMRFLSILSRT